MKSGILATGILVFLLSGNIVHSPAQTNDKSDGIWFRGTHTTLQRFAYSQAILWPTSLSGHFYLYIRQNELGHLGEIYTLRNWKRTFTMPPVWDHDSISWNYGAHPIMGSFSYLSYRNRHAHWAEAVAGTAVNSIIYEYIIAGATQRPSFNDMIVTPIAGSLLGEAIYQVKKRMIGDHRLTTLEKIVITITDPFEVFYYGFNYKKLCRAGYR
jgi:hypothetical protein